MKLLKSLLVSTLVLSSAAMAENANPLAGVKESVQQAANTMQNSAKTAVSDKVANVTAAATEKVAGAKETKSALLEKTNNSANSTKAAMGEKLNTVKESAVTAKDHAVNKATQSTQTARETLNAAKSNATQAVENTEKKLAKGTKVNINTADVETLQLLDGIGEVKAKAIVEYRKKNGPFKKAADLSKVTGIGDTTIENIKSSISFK